MNNNCWRTTDNFHWNNPVRMSDGRLFTDYRTDARQNSMYARVNHHRAGTLGYKMFLQSTAEDNLKATRDIMSVLAGSGNAYHRHHVGTMLPEKE